MPFLTNTLNAAAANEMYRDPIVAGVANAIQEIQPWYEYVPYVPVAGTSLAVQQQTDTNISAFVGAGEDLQTGVYDDQVTTAARNFNIKAIAGVANVDALANAGGAAAGADLMAAAINAKANDIARKVWKQVVQGTGADSNGFDGFVDFFGGSGSHHGTSQEIAVDASTSKNILDYMDELLNVVSAKSGTVDWIMMNGTLMNKFRARVRALGGAFEYLSAPITNRNVLAYQGIPVFMNNNIAAHTTDNHEIYAGTFESGGNDGLAMLYPAGTPAGISVVNLGESERFFGSVSRVSQMTAVACMNDKGLASVTVDISVNTGL